MLRSWLAVVPAMLLAAAVLAACSSGGSTPSAGTSSTGTSSGAAPAAGGPGGAFGAAFEKYTTCLSQHGVTLPSRAAGTRPSNFPSGPRPSNFPSGVRPSGGFGGGFGAGGGALSSTAPSGVSASAWASAQQACASVRPSFTPGAGAGGAGIDATAIAAYLSCLKDHGVKVTGTGLAALRSINRSEPAVAKALTTCQPLLPSRTAATPAPSAS